MTDLSSSSPDQLAERVALGLVVPDPDEATVAGQAALVELIRRAKGMSEGQYAAMAARERLRREAAEKERDEVLRHMGEIPTAERIRDAHSKLPIKWLTDAGGRHSVYKQSHDEACFICAIWNRAAAAEVRLTACQEQAAAEIALLQARLATLKAALELIASGKHATTAEHEAKNALARFAALQEETP